MTELTCEARKGTTTIDSTEQPIQFETVTKQNIQGAQGKGKLTFHVAVKGVNPNHVFTITETNSNAACFTYTQGSIPNDEGYFIDFKGRLGFILTLTFELITEDYKFSGKEPDISPTAITITPVEPITDTIINNVITTKRICNTSASITFTNTQALIDFLNTNGMHPLADFTLNLVDPHGKEIKMDPRLGGIRS